MKWIDAYNMFEQNILVCFNCTFQSHMVSVRTKVCINYAMVHAKWVRTGNHMATGQSLWNNVCVTLYITLHRIMNITDHV